MLARCDELPVGAVRMPVLPATDLLTNKLLAFAEHYCDYATVLPLARALREQIDWPAVREATAGSPYAEAFLLLCQRLGLVVDRPVTEGQALAGPVLREVSNE
jgi:hypothetical protein